MHLGAKIEKQQKLVVGEILYSFVALQALVSTSMLH